VKTKCSVEGCKNEFKIDDFNGGQTISHCQKCNALICQYHRNWMNGRSYCWPQRCKALIKDEQLTFIFKESTK
jgi:hypothetical protein